MVQAAWCIPTRVSSRWAHSQRQFLPTLRYGERRCGSVLGPDLPQATAEIQAPARMRCANDSQADRFYPASSTEIFEVSRDNFGMSVDILEITSGYLGVIFWVNFPISGVFPQLPKFLGISYNFKTPRRSQVSCVTCSYLQDQASELKITPKISTYLTFWFFPH